MYLQYIVNTIQSALSKFEKENFEKFFREMSQTLAIKIL